MFADFNLSRRRFLRGAAMTIAASQLGTIASAKPWFGGGGELTSLGRATTWLNSQPLSATQLGGKIVLVEFWTYSCINWRRQLPFVRAWAEKYKDQGLVVVGVHSPEFSFEKNIDNIRWAVRDMRITYPVAVDSDHAIWRGFDNEYWPALYFVDAKGKIRHTQFGEGEYEQSERVIQKLLAETGVLGSRNRLVTVDPTGSEAVADWDDLRSGENYLGFERTENFRSAGAAPDKPHIYSVPAKLGLNQWALSGSWTMRKDAIVLNEPGGSIVYRFHARDVHLVMGPAASEVPVRFLVTLDGHLPGSAHGVDVDDKGNGTVREPRMYQLVRQPKPISDRQFEIQFLGAVEGYSFTFG